MTIASLFIPNFTFNTVIGVIALILGVLIFILNKMIPKPLRKPGQFVGFSLLIVGGFLTFVVSFVEDIFARPLLATSLIGLILLGGLGYYLFVRKNE